MITSAPWSFQFLVASAAAQTSDPRRIPTRISIDPAHAPSLYDSLGVPLTASAQDIKAAYRRMAHTCHPDTGASAEEFVRLHAAYAMLSDPGKRAEHDRVALPGPGVRHGALSGRRRTWETDQCW